MAWLQLDPSSIAARQRSAPGAPSPLDFLGSLLLGAIGFMLTSIAGFVPWAVFGHYLRYTIGEAGLYATCALVFIALSGLLLHRLIIGPGSLVRFYGLFAPAFALYAAIWMGCWMHWRGDVGGVLGLLGGTFVMGTLLACAFDRLALCLPVGATLFLLNAAGYFAGGWVEARMVVHHLAGMLMWGVCYGLGFGAGLGLAFYLCQSRARALLGAPSA